MLKILDLPKVINGQESAPSSYAVGVYQASAIDICWVGEMIVGRFSVTKTDSIGRLPFWEISSKETFSISKGDAARPTNNIYDFYNCSECINNLRNELGLKGVVISWPYLSELFETVMKQLKHYHNLAYNVHNQSQDQK